MASQTKLIDDDNMQLPSRFGCGQPHADWKLLRETCPVYWCEPTGFKPFWAVTKYADIVEVERQPEIFQSEPRAFTMPADFEEYLVQKFGSLNGMTKMLVQMDGEEHTRHRMLLRPWFTPKALKDRQQTVWDICDKFFDDLAAKGKEGELDLARDLAYLYPLRVICGLLGLPPEEDQVVLAMNEAMSTFEVPPPGTDEVSGFEQLINYFAKVAADRRINPKDDLATYIAKMELDNEPLNDIELLAYFIIAGSAGHDTTASAVAGGIQALLEHPDQFQLLKDDPSKLQGAVDEILRWVSPVIQFCRTASEDYVLNGQLIKKGEHVVLYYPSGNRDADAFPNPDVFDITRTPNRHLAFGSGPHTCIGNYLAPMEIRRFLTNVLERIDTLELNGEPVSVATHLINRLQNLPVRYKLK